MAKVLLLTIVSATVGLIEILPAEPALALVALLLSEVAASVNLPAFVSVELSCNDASARFCSKSIATEAPTP
ncbi:hypothetical protein, partial [Dulcicalothrix desertica]|uniref:hypothetical protein n=1 Tax=Dulcicalothrix desertica TaxID=32056 RepID=UPI001F307E48